MLQCLSTNPRMSLNMSTFIFGCPEPLRVSVIYSEVPKLLFTLIPSG